MEQITYLLKKAKLRLKCYLSRTMYVHQFGKSGPQPSPSIFPEIVDVLGSLPSVFKTIQMNILRKPFCKFTMIKNLRILKMLSVA